MRERDTGQRKEMTAGAQDVICIQKSGVHSRPVAIVPSGSSIECVRFQPFTINLLTYILISFDDKLFSFWLTAKRLRKWGLYYHIWVCETKKLTPVPFFQYLRTPAFLCIKLTSKFRKNIGYRSNGLHNSESPYSGNLISGDIDVHGCEHDMT